jgi:ABC-type microcin C transport system duplicated ATPase subunit YejF
MSNSVLARFSLQEVARVYYWQEPHQATRIRLQAVHGEPFGSATPSANIEMVIVNPEAAAVFNNAEIGKEFNVMISPVEDQT